MKRSGATPETLGRRAEILADIRSFFLERGVVEVQTPVLGRYTVTDADVESIEVPGYGYLQTSPEYFLKRLLAAGVGDCYQLGPVFRAGELGTNHNPEFTMLEWYRLGYDHHRLMEEVADLVDRILGEGNFETVTYRSLVGDPGRPRDELDLVFSEACERLKPGRFFVTHYPADQAVLARLEKDDNTSAARFELVIDGLEIANGYHELTDPGEHERRFEEDNRIRRERGLPERTPDADFLAAIAEGLPDCAGVALGVDRLVMLALGKKSIDEVLTFRG